MRLDIRNCVWVLSFNRRRDYKATLMSTKDAMHPLIMPGILTELERSRHLHIVESTIDAIEACIFELDAGSDSEQVTASSESDRGNTDKSTAWLDTTYLRNCLISWTTQMTKIVALIDELHYSTF